MRKLKAFIISGLVTILFLSILKAGYYYLFGVKKIYILSSEVSFYDKKGLIEGYEISYNDCIDEKGNFELKIRLGSHEDRDIGFELSVLINYEQQSFYIGGTEEKLFSTKVYVKENFKETTITLDKDLFTEYRNNMIINIRQDIDQLSYKNNLVRDSNTLNFTFYVTNVDGKSEPIRQTRQFQNIIIHPLEDTEHDIGIELNRPDNKDNPLIRVHENEDIHMSLNIGGMNAEQYIFWAVLDSKQVNIDGNSYIEVEIDRNMSANAQITIDNNMPAGIYELEVFCIPSPNMESVDIPKKIISAKRYTVEVR